ncbi:unnamed protein product [Acanthoscelides obtectus]|uniref:Uncharacterized protein n=1 Tax=Acanthoscelides obtectus TaxID=200917 RepID=A0A9P0JZX9_ACAOB|nr:unnamed protein product [Acanthoscelides obtectus]CAK1633856.1 hypothetical protein AOBTE_LOCUS8439 [Acanthoscelides obtectus]
MGLSVSYLCYL